MPGKYRWILLLVASYFFYMYWEASYILLLMFSTIVDFSISLKLLSSENEKIRKLGVLCSLITNLGILAVFKYFNFAQQTMFDICSLLNVDYTPNKHELLLPIGISFYTFQTISYTLDVYWRKIRPEPHLGKFALYVSFFPQLVAGPIERAKSLLPQLKKEVVKVKPERFISGLALVMLGLFKKVVVADTLAIQVDVIYNNWSVYNGLSLLMATYLFAFQIYCDFSGYSDIAIGIARMMGYELMENFKLPYFSKNITEFWRRWHISLSTWLRDYLYIPLGGNRLGAIMTARNLMITMLLGGLWHGASWNFVVWGALNGLFLSIERYFKLSKDPSSRDRSLISKFLYTFICFNLICLTWVFFRAESFGQAMDILSAIAELSGPVIIKDTSVFFNLVIGLITLLVIEYFFLRKNRIGDLIQKHGLIWGAGFCAFLLMMIVLFGVSNGNQFIYFQF
ncbi:MAG: MBOAT family protein [Bacteroidia bacterium]|nr:MBOAT family protein [Bacteroidia bacterium]